MHLDTVQIFKFNQTAKHGPISSDPTARDHSLALSLITEEANELLQAIWDLNDSDYHLIDNADENLAKEMMDTIWVILSYCMRRGWNVPEMFRRLGESNLSKFNPNGDGTGVDGAPQYWAERFPSGKVKKSINYKPVDYSDIVNNRPDIWWDDVQWGDYSVEMEKYPR